MDAENTMFVDGKWVPAIPEPYEPNLRERLACIFGKRICYSPCACPYHRAPRAEPRREE